jgi:hypothetical protein
MDMWIQLHDFSNTEEKNVNAEQAKQALSTFNWQSELAKRDQANVEACDPGLGLVKDDGSILHICPQNNESCYILYDYSTTQKIFGFIPIKTRKTHSIESCPLSKAIELIQYHFDGCPEKILAKKN